MDANNQLMNVDSKELVSMLFSGVNKDVSVDANTSIVYSCKYHTSEKILEIKDGSKSIKAVDRSTSHNRNITIVVSVAVTVAVLLIITCILVAMGWMAIYIKAGPNQLEIGAKYRTNEEIEVDDTLNQDAPEKTEVETGIQTDTETHKISSIITWLINLTPFGDKEPYEGKLWQFHLLLWIGVAFQVIYIVILLAIVKGEVNYNYLLYFSLLVIFGLIYWSAEYAVSRFLCRWGNIIIVTIAAIVIDIIIGFFVLFAVAEISERLCRESK